MIDTMIVNENCLRGKVANLTEQLGENQQSYFVSILSLLDVMRRDDDSNVLLSRDFCEVSPDAARKNIETCHRYHSRLSRLRRR